MSTKCPTCAAPVRRDWDDRSTPHYTYAQPALDAAERAVVEAAVVERGTENAFLAYRLTGDTMRSRSAQSLASLRDHATRRRRNAVDALLAARTAQDVPRG